MSYIRFSYYINPLISKERCFYINFVYDYDACDYYNSECWKTTCMSLCYSVNEKISVKCVVLGARHIVDGSPILNACIIWNCSALYRMDHVTCRVFRFIDILNKHKPQLSWNAETMEHEFYYK